MRNCWAHNIQPGSRTCPASPHGGNCIIRTPTRRRHAANQLLMLQNPHRSQPHAPRHLQDLAAEPIDAKKLSQHSPSSGSSAKKFAQQAKKRRFWGVLSVQGEYFRACTMTLPRRANFFAHEARQHVDVETNNTTAHPQQGTAETGITSAQAKCSKNAHFSPAKAMAVSIPRRHKRVKATTVSDNRPTWPTGPGCDTRGRQGQAVTPWAATTPPPANFACNSIG